MKTKTLIVEDDSAIRELLYMTLSRDGHEIFQATNVSTARTLFERNQPDLVLLDWMLPDASGLEWLKSLDKNRLKLPAIIMLTAKSQEIDKLDCFKAGVDDYITKPFSVRELTARIKAVLKRTNPNLDKTEFSIDQLKLNMATHEVTVKNRPVSLGPTEFSLLYFFMTNKERVFSRAQLIDNVWGINSDVEERAVDVSIRRLRKSLEQFGYDSLVKTVYGAGYRFSGG